MGLLLMPKLFPPAQPDLQRIPLWIWLVGSLIIVLIGVLWTLREESEEKVVTSPRPDTLPEPVVARQVAPAPPPQPDDLKVVVGIGPKIAKLLNDHGIYTFEQLAETEVSFLESLLDEQEWQIADPGDWPAQARQLAEAKKKQQG